MKIMFMDFVRTQRVKCLFIVSALVIVLTALTGCNQSRPAGTATPLLSAKPTLTQVSVINALMQGDYDGSIRIGDLKKYGDFGLGTVDRLDGELVVVDGGYYQIKSDGRVVSLGDQETSPFAMVTFLPAGTKQEIGPVASIQDLEGKLKQLLPMHNQFYAIRLDGTFTYLKARSVPAQVKPYPPLVEVTKKQAVFEFNNVAGSIVGFWSPEYMQGLDVPGLHLHFLSGDHTKGGHLLDARFRSAQVQVQGIGDFRMLLPTEDRTFAGLDLTSDQKQAVEKVEK